MRRFVWALVAYCGLVLGGLQNPQANVPSDELYAFSELESVLAVTTPALEQRLIEDAKDGVFDQHTLAQAALIASGLSDPQQVSEHHTQVQNLSRRAQSALKHLPAVEQAAGLLRWLHEYALTTYAAEQSLLPKVLDSGVYNCVSVTVLYNSIGQTLGLRLRAVETEKHVFSKLLMANQAYDIETTTQYGFDPSVDAINQFEAKTGFKHIGSEQVEQTRVVGDVGLVALIYFNRALAAVEADNTRLSLHLFAKALWFDPELTQARASFMSLISVQAAQWLQAKQFTRALDLLTFGLKLEPAHKTMRYNWVAGWTNWALFEAEHAEPEKALIRIQKAYKITQDARLIELQAQIFMRHALVLAEQGDWADGMALMNDNRAKLLPESVPFLDVWRVDYLLQWLADHLTKQDYPAAYDVAKQILLLDQENTYVHQNMRFLLQEWSREQFQAAGPLVAEQLLTRVIQAHQDHAGLVETAQNYVYWAVEKFSKAQQFEQAIALIGRQKDRLEGPIYTRLLSAQYHQWSEQLLQTKAWQQAIQAYQAAQAQLPGTEAFVTNEKYAWDQWGKARLKDKAYQGAAMVYQQALQRYPEDAVFQQNLRYCQAFLH